jgi:hypothetical protein
MMIHRVSHTKVRGTLAHVIWVDQGQLIIASVPLADGVDDGRFVNGPYDHDP